MNDSSLLTEDEIAAPANDAHDADSPELESEAPSEVAAETAAETAPEVDAEAGPDAGDEPPASPETDGDDFEDEFVDSVPWHAYPVPHGLKVGLLLHLLDAGEAERALVFVRTRQRVNRLAEWLSAQGITTDRSHGNRSPRQRAEALKALGRGKVEVVVATEIPPDNAPDSPISLVYLDPPTSGEGFLAWADLADEWDTDVHVFFAPREHNQLRSIERSIEDELTRRELEDFDYEADLEDPLDERGKRGSGPKKGRASSAPAGSRRAGSQEAGQKKSRGRQKSAPKAKSGRSKGRGQQQGGGRGQQQGGNHPGGNQGGGNQAPGNYVGGNQAAGHHGGGGGQGYDLDQEEEARIRARAEEMQAAAVAARLNPSRMGIMDMRNTGRGKPGSRSGGSSRAGNSAKGQGDRRRGGGRKRSRH